MEKPRRKTDGGALKDSARRAAFAESFCAMVEPLPLDRALSNCWDSAKASMAEACKSLPPPGQGC